MNSTATGTTPDAANPLATIGLALSGGGFRAAAFSLGCLAYLDHFQVDETDGKPRSLLHRVQFMASASGGSLTSLFYATCRYSGQSFQTCYTLLRDFMTGDTLFRQVFNTLETDAAWTATPHKQRNLINAFSLAYQGLFEKALAHKPGQPATLGLFGRPGANQPRICVNSTEFRNGLTFRFQNVDGAGLVGNFGLHLDPKQPEVAAKLRLGDIMAASSCFPSGLEPIMFPRDFVHGPANDALTAEALRNALICRDPLKQARQIRDNAPADTPRLTTQEQLDLYDTERVSPPAPPEPGDDFGLMDGGIDDNQGLGSLLLADARNDNGQRFGTLIACDVNSPYMSQYQLPQVKRGFVRDRSLRFWGWLLALLGAGLLGWGCGVNWPTAGPVLATLGGLILLVDAVANLLIWRGLLSLKKSGTWGWAATEYIGYFFTIPLGSLWQMLDARLRSTVILASDVYMKQIRRMHYERFYNDDEYQNRRMTCMLHTLARDTYTPPGGSTVTARDTAGCVAHYDLRPSALMQDMANEARKMETTLWFDPTEMNQNVRDKLIATGQFTLCYNLLLYLCRLDAAGRLTPDLQRIQHQMLTDWQAFQQNPQWLVQQLN